MYNVGQADNLLEPGTGSVSMPKYTNSCPTPAQYPCDNKNIDLSRVPKQNNPDINANRDYVDDYNSTYPERKITRSLLNTNKPEI